MEEFMKTVLYIHGFNGNPKGGTYEGLCSFFAGKPDYKVISFPFPKLHTDASETQNQINHLIKTYNVKILVGASLGGFYALCCKKSVFKIAINPCMVPSKEIPLLKDRNTGKSIYIEENVISKWKELEKYQLPKSSKNAFGIFGKEDATFHFDENHNFEPLFRKYFPSDNHFLDSENSVFVEGEHSLNQESIKIGMEKAIQYFEMLEKPLCGKTFSFTVKNLKIEVRYTSKDFTASCDSDFGKLSFYRHIMFWLKKVFTEDSIRSEYGEEIYEEFPAAINFLKSNPDFVEKSKSEYEKIISPLEEIALEARKIKSEKKKLFKQGKITINEYSPACERCKGANFEIWRTKEDFERNLAAKTKLDIGILQSVLEL